MTRDVDLPSQAASGGNLAVRIFAPGVASETRYPEGAPVIILAQGGSSPGTLNLALTQATDMVRIVFVFPGGTDAQSGRHSDGTYDFRGPNCIAALRDVILYAAGSLTDAMGQTIDDVVPTAVIHENVGLIGTSLGGNIVAVTPAQYGASFQGFLRYVVQWESPVQNQVAAVEVGGARIDCPGGGQSGIPVTNPRYRGYGNPTLDVDYSQLAYDPSDATRPVFWDGTGDGVYTTVVDPLTGCDSPDLNLDGNLALSEDFPMDGSHLFSQHVYSRAATAELSARGIFGTSWPANIATVAQAKDYWDLREAVANYSAALAALPDLEGMVVASVEDHVQNAIDHPHIRSALEGWMTTSTWVQLNPSPFYDIAVDPSLAGRTDLPDLAPNTPPANWSAPASYAFPEDIADGVAQVAAIWQMADRAHAAQTTDNHVVGQGLGNPNPNRVRVYLAAGAPTVVDFLAYAAGKWGCNVASADLDGAKAEILTGPGPGDVFGPQVRGFDRTGAAMNRINFFAYGTLKFGVNVGAGNVDADAYSEILSGPGAGVVFGPHVRGWNFDGATLAPISKISFFAYASLKYGVNVSCGSIDADSFAEILTAPGPGIMFGPQVRAYDYDGSSVSSISKVNFDAFSVNQYGADVASGDVDADGYAEIAGAPGPGVGVNFPSRFLGFDYDGAAVASLPGFDVTAFTTSYGGRVGLGRIDSVQGADLLAGAGRDPSADSTVKAYMYDGSTLSLLPGSFLPFGTATYGVNVTAGALGY